MTAQDPDILRVEGDEYCLLGFPLEQLFHRHRRRPRFALSSSALWRGYRASWEIRDGMPHLSSVMGRLANMPAESEPPDPATLSQIDTDGEDFKGVIQLPSFRWPLSPCAICGNHLCAEYQITEKADWFSGRLASCDHSEFLIHDAKRHRIHIVKVIDGQDSVDK